MYFEGIGTIQDFKESIKYTWLCSLNGNRRCLKKIKLIKQKLEEEEFVKVSAEIPKLLENDFVDNNDPISAFKLGYWYENSSRN